MRDGRANGLCAGGSNPVQRTVVISERKGVIVTGVKSSRNNRTKINESLK